MITARNVTDPFYPLADVGQTLHMETDEELETGYGAATAPGDNLCNDYAQGLADGFMALATGRGDRVEAAGPDVAMNDSGSPSLFGNVVVVRRPVADDAWPTLAERIHAFYAGHAGGPFIVFSAWPTPDLTTHGFGRIGHPPLMYRPVGPVLDEPVAGLELRPVTDAASAEEYERTLVEAYPDPALLPYARRRFLAGDSWSAPGWHHWVGYVGGAAVATASAYVGPHHIDVEMISARPEVRGRGVGRAVTAAATVVAPDRPAMLISSDDGRPVYERLGYVPILRFTLWAGHRR
jgi:GNAT superfamily N-acetyltransferase